MDIGKVKMNMPLVLAPMAGVTDKPFRLLVKEQGCDLLVSEMVSSKGLLYNNQKTFDLLKFEEVERPFAMQLFGSNPDEMAEAAKKIEALKPDMIDVNMGCPVPKVVNNGEGSALLKNPQLIYEMVAKMVDSVDIPITVKIRIGWDEKSINACEVASVIEKAGASALSIHARTRSQFYTGNANWQVIKDVVETVKMPVIGNGDIRKPQDVLLMLEQTGCQGVMIGRAADGNPWLFAQAKALLRGENVPLTPTAQEKFELLHRHLDLLIDYKGESLAIKEMRRHAAAYTKGLPHASEFRNYFNQAITKEDFAIVVDKYMNKLTKEEAIN